MLVAVSGGPDSMALLHVMARLRAKLAFGLFAHGVDHGLRAEAPDELELAAALADRVEVPFTRTKVSVRAGSNLQARARDARWEALRRAAASARCDRVATAHHADDRAETVLLRLLRGAGPAELAVLAPREQERVRPLVRARRSDVEQHVARHGLDVARDPSNDDARYLRARLRHEVLPLLERLSPRIVENLCDLADRAGALERGEGAHIYRLPKRTQIALAELARNQRSGARILLPGGLVATRDKTQPEVEPQDFRDTTLKRRTSAPPRGPSRQGRT